MNQNTAQATNPDGTLVFESGKDYRPVAMRLKDMLGEHPTWRVINSRVYFNQYRVVTRTDIFNENGRLLATGHAEEVYNASQINMFSALPCAETSSCGRALAVLGYIPSEKDLEPIIIDGEEYSPVMARVFEFRKNCPDLTLTSKILYHDDWRYTVKAEIRDANDNVLSSGHEEGLRSTNPDDINCYYLLESVETSAYGRALAFRGYHGNTLASAEEVINARVRRAQQNQAINQPVQIASQGGSYEQPGQHQPDQLPQPTSAPVTHHQEQLPLDQQPADTTETRIQKACDQAQLIANDLISKGFKDESSNVEALRKTPPAHNFVVLQDLKENNVVTGRQIVAHCPPTNPAKSELHGLGFNSLTDQPQYWLLNFRY